MTRITSVLFICMGNICRSPSAEAVFRTKAREQGVEISSDSAGTIAYHQGECPDTRARAAGERRGFDFSGITARAVTNDDFEQFDLILAADEANLADLKQRCPAHLQYKLRLILSYIDGGYTEVPDPYYGGDKGFELVLDLLEQSCDALIASLK